MIAYQIDLQALARVKAVFAAAPALVLEELEAAALEADALLEREVKERMPVGATGGLRASVFSQEQRVGEFGVEGLVGTPMAHAVPVEIGTRPHMPPIAPLVDWVMAKLGISSEKTARGVAFAIAKKISARGTTGQFPFQLTYLEQTPDVLRIFEAAAARIAARSGGAA